MDFIFGGSSGGQGPAGDSAYQVWLAAGNTGTEQDFLDSLVGAQGPQGIQGETGPQGPAGADGANVTIDAFSATNNSNQTWNSTSYVTVTGWTLDFADGIFDFDTTTGILTVNHTGKIFLGANLIVRQTTGNNRATPIMAIHRGSAVISGMKAEGYTRLATTAGGGRQNLHVGRAITVTSGDTFSVRVSVNSTLYTHEIVNEGNAFTAFLIS